MKFSEKHLFYFLWIIGSVGAIGEATILHHYLNDSYPYKVTSLYRGYVQVSNIASVCGVILSIFAPYYLKIARERFVVTLQIIICPLTFLFAFSLFSLNVYAGEYLFTGLQSYFDGHSVLSLFLTFTRDVLVLMTIGCLISFSCEFVTGKLKK